MLIFSVYIEASLIMVTVNVRVFIYYKSSQVSDVDRRRLRQPLCKSTVIYD